MGFLPPVVQVLRVTAADGIKEWAKYEAASKKSAVAAAAAAEAAATKQEQAAKKASAVASAAAQKAATAAEQVAARTGAATDRAVARADKAAVELQTAYMRTEALMTKGTATAAELDAAVKAETVAMDRLQAAATRANEVMAKGAAATAAAMDRAAAVAAKGSSAAAEAAAVASAARKEADKAAAAVESSAAKSKAALASMNRVADGALKGVGLTAGIVGWQSLKMGVNFETATRQLVTGAGEFESALSGVRQGILDLAGKVGQTPQQLAEGMFMIESAGIRGAAGVGVLGTAAKGAVANGAELGTTVDALTTIMVNYGLISDDAAKTQQNAVVAMNQLTAAASASKVDVQDMAASMSTILPVAHQAGLSFAEVSGALAAMTNTGETAQNAAQHLAFAMRALQGPNDVAKKQMARLGLSATDVSLNLGKRGLTGTLELLTGAIAKHSKGGKVLISSFNASKQSAQALGTMLNAMPPDLRRLSEALQKGGITAATYSKTLKQLPADQQAMGEQFLTLYKRANGFSDLLKKGGSTVQTYQEALQKMMGGAVGAQAALALTANGMNAFTGAVAKVEEASKGANSEVAGWERAQQDLSIQLAQQKGQITAWAVEIGNHLIPAVKGIIGFTKEHETTTKVLVGTVGGLVAALAAYALVAKTVAMVTGTATAAKVVYGATLGKLRTEVVATRVEMTALGSSFSKTSAVIGSAALIGGVLMLSKMSQAGEGAAANVDETAAALRRLVESGKATGPVLSRMGTDLAMLNHWYDDFHSANLKINAAMQTVHLGWITGGEDVRGYTQRIRDLDSGLAQMVSGGRAREAAVAMASITAEAVKQGTDVDKLKAAFPQYAAALRQSATAAKDAKTATAGLATAQDQLNAALDTSQNKLLTIHGAENAYYEALDRVKAALRENGKTLNEHTSAGRANRESLDGLVRASLDRLQALKDSGAPAAKFNEALREEQANLKKSAEKLTDNKAKIKEYTDQLAGIPKQVATNVLILGATTANATLQGILNRVALINGRAAVVHVSAGAGNVREDRTVRRAEGGLIPGPPSSVDNVLAAGPGGEPVGLATGEFVVNAHDTARNLPLLRAVNAGKRVVAAYATGGMVRGFASGGRINTRAVVDRALSGSGSSRSSKPKLSEAAKKAAADLKSAINSVNHWIPAGIAQAVARGRDSAIKQIQTLGVQVSKAHNGFVTNLVKTSGATLIRLGTTYDAIKDKLKAAQSNLKQLREDSAKVAADVAGRIVESGNLLGIDPATAMTASQEDALKAAQARQRAAESAAASAERAAESARERADRAQERFDLTKKTASDKLTLKFAEDEAAQAEAGAAAARQAAQRAAEQAEAAGRAGGTDPARAMIDRLHQSITTAQQFGQALAELKQKGLDATSLSQLASAGPEAGLATARALLQGGQSAITEVAQLQAQLAATAKTSGQQVADAMYQSGIKAAEGLVKGLQSQEKALLAQITRMVQQMVVAVKKQLKIKSPSGVTEDEVGDPMGAGVGVGFTKGLTKQLPTMNAALAGIPGALGFSVGGIPRTAGPAAAPVGEMTATVPIVVQLGNQTVYRAVQTATLRHEGRNSTTGLALQRGR